MSERYLLEWDKDGERLYETGVKNCVLFPWNNTLNDGAGGYGKGVAWNGITGITESPSGAEANAMYADDTKYLNLYSAEELGATVEAYMYPDEFAECDGSAEIADGIYAGQQSRKMFGLAYRTTYGNDTEEGEYGYKIHLIYGCKASPSEKAYSTINDSPEAITFSWELATVPTDVPGYKKTANIVIDSTKADKAKLASFLQILYGTPASEGSDPTATASSSNVELTASVVAATFATAVSNVSGTYEFTYDGSDWKLNGDAVTLATYGITTEGTPASADKITVAFVAGTEPTIESNPRLPLPAEVISHFSAL